MDNIRMTCFYLSIEKKEWLLLYISFYRGIYTQDQYKSYKTLKHIL